MNLPIWNTLEPGTLIPPLIKHPDHKQIFMYSAVTWNRHLIHYNSQRAQQEGHRDVVVQRALLGNYLAQCITAWTGNNGELRQLEWKVLRSAYPGDELRCQGEVAEKTLHKNRRLVVCAMQIINQSDDIVVVGTAHIIMRA